MLNVTTILFGGAAGDGVKEIALNCARLLQSCGYQIFTSFEYPSLIRGGHNYCRLTFGKEKIWNDHTKVDVLVALSAETVVLHKKEMNKGALIISEKDLPMTTWTKEVGAKPILRTAVALGALCKYFGIPLEKLNNIFEANFKRAAENNIILAKRGYDAFGVVSKNILKISPPIKGDHLTDGNEAFAEGSIKAGLQMYVAYPMTPSSSILHYLARVAPENNLKVIQAENELGAANMVLGAAWAGAGAVTGTSGGGFALMEETFSFAGIAELPFVVALSQRPGPATGVPTGTAQGDLNMARSAGHGEFPRVVLAPGDAAESYLLGGEAMNLAWQFQIPVIVLLDKHLSESVTTSMWPVDKLKIREGKILSTVAGDYARYRFTPSGVSPLAFPGTKNAVVKVNSYEHDEHGFMSEDPKMIVKMTDKRAKKMKLITKDIARIQPVKIYGNKTAKNIVLFWGSTKGVLLEAMKEVKKPIKLVQVLCVEPLPVSVLVGALKGAKKIICVENNSTGQLADLVGDKCDIKNIKKVLRYDGKQFMVEDLVEILKKF